MKKLSTILAATCALLLSQACGRPAGQALAAGGPLNLDAAGFQTALAKTADALLLDVRTPGEFAAGRLAGALNMDIGSADFQTRAGSLDRTRPLFVYCRTGNRSSHAIALLIELGYTNITHLACGIVCWNAAGLPVERADLSP
jgi:rhodanese-related sulfurtransferase